MGLFDHIYVAPTLPRKLPHNKDPRMIEWQTKCLPDPWCRTFRLTWEGRLEQMDCEPDARVRPEIWSASGWSSAHHLLDADYDTINFYDLSDDENGVSWWTEFRAVFKGGELASIEHLDTHESSCEAHRRQKVADEIEWKATEAARLSRLSAMAPEKRVQYEARRLEGVASMRALERAVASAIYGSTDCFNNWAKSAGALPSLFQGAPATANPRRIPWPWEETP